MDYINKLQTSDYVQKKTKIILEIVLKLKKKYKIGIIFKIK